MKKILITDKKGNLVSAEFILAFHSDETQKTYVVLNNSDIIFNKDSSYNNLEVFEIIKEEHNIFYIADIPDNEWQTVQNTMIKELFSQIP